MGAAPVTLTLSRFTLSRPSLPPPGTMRAPAPTTAVALLAAAACFAGACAGTDPRDTAALLAAKKGGRGRKGVEHVMVGAVEAAVARQARRGRVPGPTRAPRLSQPSRPRVPAGPPPSRPGPATRAAPANSFGAAGTRSTAAARASRRPTRCRRPARPTV